MHVVNMRTVDEGVQRCVYTRRAWIKIERAMRIQSHHRIFVLRAAVQSWQPQELVEIQGREALELHRAQVPTGPFDPQNGDRLTGQRVGHFELRRGVSTPEIGYPT